MAVHCDDKDVLRAECVRMFHTATFPAMLLLRREEVEHGKTKGVSIIVAVHAGGSSQNRRAFKDPPFDLMYGFRGRGVGQGLLSPFEMLRFWSMEEIRPPSAQAPIARSELTADGERYKEECRSAGGMPNYAAGTHYVAIAAEGRILLPDIPALGNLRHRWVWEQRPRPTVPILEQSTCAEK